MPAPGQRSVRTASRVELASVATTEQLVPAGRPPDPGQAEARRPTPTTRPWRTPAAPPHPPSTTPTRWPQAAAGPRPPAAPTHPALPTETHRRSAPTHRTPAAPIR